MMIPACCRVESVAKQKHMLPGQSYLSRAIKVHQNRNTPNAHQCGKVNSSCTFQLCLGSATSQSNDPTPSSCPDQSVALQYRRLKSDAHAMMVGLRKALKSSSFHSGAAIRGLMAFIVINCRG